MLIGGEVRLGNNAPQPPMEVDNKDTADLLINHGLRSLGDGRLAPDREDRLAHHLLGSHSALSLRLVGPQRGRFRCGSPIPHSAL